MIINVFAVRDLRSEAFGTPVFLPSKGEAIRTFSDAVNKADDNSLLYKHPEDFILYHLGTFDTDNGRFLTVDPESLAFGKDLAIPLKTS